MNDIIVQYLVNYGLAGIVIYIFYRLISNELKELKQSIDNLSQRIDQLILVIEHNGKAK